MSDPFLLAADLLIQQLSEPVLLPTPPDPSSQIWDGTKAQQSESVQISPNVEVSAPEFSQNTLGYQTTVWLTEASVFVPPHFPSASEYLSWLVKNRFFPTANIELAIAQSDSLGEAVPDKPTAFYRSNPIVPASGPQLYHQRLAALRNGQIYTRLPADSFWSSWANATEQPTYEQWKKLLAQEARAIAAGQGSNRLSVLLGDSISLWFPQERLPSGQLWLNQGISGDTTGGILTRLSAFEQTRPDIIYVLAGINDLRRGETDEEILWNLREIMYQLREQHPQAQVVVQSILPTRLESIPNHRIRNINTQIEAIAREEGALYLDIHSSFTDEQGNLRREFTTDGLHLNPRGYEVWQWALQRSETLIARNRVY